MVGNGLHGSLLKSLFKTGRGNWAASPEACSEGDQYRFIATGIQQPAKPISPVYLANEYEKTNRMDFLREKRSFLNNPLGKINAQLNGEIKVMKTEGQDGSSLFASESVVDFIETDHK